MITAANGGIEAWTFEGHHRESGKLIRFSGWEEWDLDDELKVVKSLGWYNVEDYDQQIGG